MDSKLLNNQQPNPKRLKDLASDVKYSRGNKLLHQFVLDNSAPNISGSESYINAALLSISGTPVNALNNEGYSPLHLAVLKKNVLMVKKLLSCLPNIDVNKKCSFDRDDNTALHLATKLGHLPIIEELLNSGADVDKRNKDGFTPLCLATGLGNLALMEMLIRKGADVNAKCKCGIGFHFALEFNSSEDVKSFITNSAALDIIDYENENILKYSARSNPRFLLRRRNVNEYSFSILSTPSCYNLTPLHFAIKSNNIEAIKILIISGVDLNWNSRGSLHYSLLRHVARFANVATFAFLVSNGLDVNAKDHVYYTPLLYAVEESNVEIIKFLIQNGADLNDKIFPYDTLIHSAALARALPSIDFFLESGFDINAQNKDGCTPLHCALDIPTHFINLDVVKFLIKKGADVNAKDHWGDSCLHYAVGVNDLEAVKFLISNGADLDAINHCNETAHDYAQFHHNEEIIKFLESIGAKCYNEISLHS